MSSGQPSQKTVVAAVVEPKARGANRSTKAAGKLKVLPDQVEPVLQGKPVELVLSPPPQGKIEEEEEGDEAESDDDNGDDEEEPDDIEVRPSCSIHRWS